MMTTAMVPSLVSLAVMLGGRRSGRSGGRLFAAGARGGGGRGLRGLSSAGPDEERDGDEVSEGLVHHRGL